MGAGSTPGAGPAQGCPAAHCAARGDRGDSRRGPVQDSPAGPRCAQARLQASGHSTEAAAAYLHSTTSTTSSSCKCGGANSSSRSGSSAAGCRDGVGGRRGEAGASAGTQHDTLVPEACCSRNISGSGGDDNGSGGGSGRPSRSRRSSIEEACAPSDSPQHAAAAAGGGSNEVEQSWTELGSCVSRTERGNLQQQQQQQARAPQPVSWAPPLPGLLLAVLVLALGAWPQTAVAQVVNIPSLVMSPDSKSTSAATLTPDGYYIVAAGAGPQAVFSVTSSGASSQFNLVVWYRYPDTNGNGPLKKSGSNLIICAAGDTSGPIVTGGNQQTVPLTVTNETNVFDTVANGILTGCYVVRISLVSPGTINYVGSPAYAGIRAGSPPWLKCSDVVNIPPNCNSDLFTYTPSGTSVPGGTAVITQPTTGSTCAFLGFNVPNGACTDAEGTALSYRWEAYGNGSTTPWLIKYGQNVSFSTGLPGLDLPAGTWVVNLVVVDTPLNASLVRNKTISFTNIVVNPCTINYPPTAPVLAGTTCGVDPVTVTANSTDANWDPFTFAFTLRNGLGAVVSSSNGYTSNPTVSYTSTNTAGGTLAPGTYSLTVSVKDGNAVPATGPNTTVSLGIGWPGPAQPSSPSAATGAAQPGAS
ncbi:hypothetical protein HXX76_010189 [Chlamydomonas incerta]|uniref:Uncharacterized protein n=1 Tax=Chlamydomonas incerta TaxID=51695 RepID=A0A835VW45_CHLIN|nr:hypothetical protein HXX76_010189 [Chlamydomonas incerta]|eukprot:KAG2430090.1 hypothetical protein HXX76_010189 [Chlamydomonas incerta]